MSRPENAFLRSLSPRAFRLVEEQLTPVDLALGSYVQHDEAGTDWVLFPVTCLLSMISRGEQGESVETSMVGAEGAAGLLEACGSGVSGVDCVVQVDGKAWRIPSLWCRNLANAEPDFAANAWRAAELQVAESRQSGLCQAMHSVEQRFAKWLLESMERSGGRNPLPMTQEFLAAMLGVSRTTVTGFASRLQAAGMITQNRGRITVADKDRLESLACGCRKAIHDQRARLGLSLPMTRRHQASV